MEYNSSQTVAPPTQPENLPESRAIAVEIYDQIYRLRGTDPAYIERLAQVVDAKMRAVSSMGNTVDSLRVAVLAALNICDELETLRQRYEALAGSLTVSQVTLRSRAGSLAGMLDEILEDRKVG
ncbi:cell division protein ZapA [Edaphobacter albus]|uniref:cell division protein ZapA n=1 Tax=Edaphobacter sp. 4G125 TaxID=2763071 RepID=UPI0016447B16|nr:cell division protein ZapA [Edaphobacter sp. 4G125]QNI37715.1 cell division protein ZapA [Edaphobacter sp. 4G125]